MLLIVLGNIIVYNYISKKMVNFIYLFFLKESFTKWPILQGGSSLEASPVPAPGSPDSGSDMDELNTKELAQKISAELKRYSIPQAIFAQRVLCRSYF